VPDSLGKTVVRRSLREFMTSCTPVSSRPSSVRANGESTVRSRVRASVPPLAIDTVVTATFASVMNFFTVAVSPSPACV
jgi:hypothetical protein